MHFIARKAGGEARTINRKWVARGQFSAHRASLISVLLLGKRGPGAGLG